MKRVLGCLFFEVVRLLVRTLWVPAQRKAGLEQCPQWLCDLERFTLQTLQGGLSTPCSTRNTHYREERF